MLLFSVSFRKKKKLSQFNNNIDKGSVKMCNMNISIPTGLCDLLKDITNEVIRCQPTNICEFIADYLQLKDFMKREKYIQINEGEKKKNQNQTTSPN